MVTAGKRVFLFGIVLAIASFIILSGPHKTYALTWTQVTTSGLTGGVASKGLRLINFKDKLYLSIGYATGVRIYSSSDGIAWTQANTTGFGVAANEDATIITNGSVLYAGTITGGTAPAELWQTTSGTGWTQVGLGGFGGPNNTDINAMGVFNDQLYVGFANLGGAEVFRLNSNGSTTKVNSNGFDGNSVDIYALKEFDGNFYAGTMSATGAEIWKTSNGTTWTAAMQGGFSDANNVAIRSFFVYHLQFYAGTINGVTGTELWRTTTSDTSWEQTNTNSFGIPFNLWVGDMAAIINNTVYIGTRNMAVGAQLYLSSDGSIWTQEGQNGFGNPTSFEVDSVTLSGGRVYLAFADTGSASVMLWRSDIVATLSITDPALGDGTVDDPYSATVNTENGTTPYTYEVTDGSLPDGLSLDASTGDITGTPTKEGDYTFTVTINDSGVPEQTASREMSLKINAAAVEETLPETGGGLPLLSTWLDGFIRN